MLVTALSTTPIKGTQVHSTRQLELDVEGARGNRSFYVIDERDRMVNGKHFGELQKVVADFEVESGELELRLPDRPPVAGPATLGGEITTRFFSGPRRGQLVEGPFAAALSEFVGQPLRLVGGAGSAVDRGRRGGASLISRASLAQLAEIAGDGGLDARRFRMLIEIDGVDAHAEDAWIGRRTAVGDAVVAWHGHVGRCLTTGRDPETGVSDLPTLDLLGSYRRDLDTTERLPFGIYGEVLEPGRVCVGDPVRLLDA